MDNINPDILLEAYMQGIFPMSDGRKDPNIDWYDPSKRGVLPLNRFHVSRRLARTIRNETYRISVDTYFNQIIKECAKPRPGRSKTWINETIINAYTQLYERGHAHSIECWNENELAGGLYGISIGAAFFGESMFSAQRDASKVALVYLVARLRFCGYRLLDTQFMSPHLRSFGGLEISRGDYLRRLRTALSLEADFSSLQQNLPPNQVLELSQSSAQISYTACSIAESAGLEENIQPLKTTTGANP